MVDGALWFVWATGFLMGFAYRLWGERRAKRHDPPSWMARLGHSLATQFMKVDHGHKFAGDDVTVTSEQVYSDGKKTFLVRVEREHSLTDA